MVLKDESEGLEATKEKKKMKKKNMKERSIDEDESHLNGDLNL